MEILAPAEIVIVCLNVVGARFLDLLLLTFAEDYPQRLHYRLCYVVLNRKDVFHLAVVALRPQMISVGDVHELCGDAQLVSHLPDASLEHRRNLELPPNLSDVLVLPLECKRGSPRRDAE